MKKLYILISLMFIAASGFAQTTVPGGNVSGTWTLTGSPYLIQGAIMIPNDSTLTIEPGVQVEFQGSYKFLVLGQLLAIGTVQDSITFTATITSTGWLGIRFDNTTSNNDTSKFYYCRFEYGKATGTSPNDCGGALYFNYFSKVIISNSHISNCSANAAGGGIYCNNNSSPIIKKNIIAYNTSQSGSGIYCNNNSSPIISNNNIFNNTSQSGGGVFCDNNSGPLISDNIISHNSATYNSGGGIYCYSSISPTIINNTISYNSSSNRGGGIFCVLCTATISNNTISYNQNSGGLGGGGIYTSGGSSSDIISNNIISYNSTNSSNGGGIYFGSGQTKILNNYISNNTSTTNGGGISFDAYGSPVLINNAICNNHAVNGGGISSMSPNSTIINNTISNNSAQKGGAIFYSSAANQTVRNSVLWGNTATISGNQIYLDDDSSDPNIFYSDVQGGQSAIGLNTNVFYLGTYTNNIDANPLFIAPSAGSGTGYNGVNADWSLQGTSPCINVADTIGTYPAMDLASNPRVSGCRIDMGAYEYQYMLSINTISITCSGNSYGSAVVVATGGTAPYSYIWNTIPAQNNDTASGLSEGNYIVIATDSHGCSTVDSITIPSQIIVNNPQSMCNGNSYIINSHTYTTTGIYQDTLTTIHGCDSIVITNLTVNPVYSINNPQTICDGDQYIFNGHIYTVSGNYFDTLITVHNCDSIITTQLTVNPIPPIPVITQNANILTSSSATGNQWYNQNGILSGATSQNYTVTGNGNFFVIVSENGCISDTSNIITVIDYGISELQEFSNVYIFPNPTTDNLTIETTEKAALEILNIEGQIIKTINTAEKQTSIDVSNLAGGIYIIKAKTEKGVAVKKFIKE